VRELLAIEHTAMNWQSATRPITLDLAHRLVSALACEQMDAGQPESCAFMELPEAVLGARLEL
jgi:hypothetical protein